LEKTLSQNTKPNKQKQTNKTLKGKPNILSKNVGLQAISTHGFCFYVFESEYVPI
jgi:hypothetical protein